VRNILTVFLLSISQVAVAQDFPVMDWSGMIQTEAMNSAMEEASRSGPTTAQQPALFGQFTTALIYTPSLVQRRQNLASFVAKTRETDPAGARKMEQLFSSSDIVVQIDQAMASRGLTAYNLVDAFTVYWISAWEAANGVTHSQTTREQAQIVKEQVARGMVGIPALNNATNAQKQQFAEALLIQAAMIDGAVEESANDAAKLGALSEAVRRGALASGLDLNSVTLTPRGFVPISRATEQRQ
jgi:hypothetical protein